MGIDEMYEDFRNRYPELTKAVDGRHAQIFESVQNETAYMWFESVAGALNAQMGNPKQRTEFASIFKYFDMKFRTGSKKVKNCIDVSFVENLFWEVRPKKAAPVWCYATKELATAIYRHSRPYPRSSVPKILVVRTWERPLEVFTDNGSNVREL